MTAGVIFDCDGVLVDSEPVSNRVLAQMLTEHGLPTTTEQAMRHYMGSSASSVLAAAQERLGGPLPDGFLDDYERRAHAEFEAELRAVDGVEGALDRIALPVCVASSGSHRKINFTLGLTGLLPRFEGRIFSSQDVQRGKPFPDLFLHAAESMGFDPGSTVVVEDSLSGVRAGVAAGMRVLAYADHTPADQLAGAGGRVFAAMDELPGLLR